METELSTDKEKSLKVFLFINVTLMLKVFV